MVRIWFLTEGAREIESWGPGFTRQGRRESAGFQGGLREGGPRVLVLYQEGGPAVFQEFAAKFQGIPNEVLLGTNSPEGGRGGPGGLELHQTRVRSGPGGLVLHQGGCDRSGPRGGGWIPGNSRLCSSVQIPQNVATTGLIPTAARGVNINGLRHLYQGSVGDDKQLERWCSRFTRGH